jgi:hypothetical protein
MSAAGVWGGPTAVRHACVPVFSPNASQATGVRPVNASEKETFMAPRWDGGGVWFTYISCDDFSYLAFSLVGARLATRRGFGDHDHRPT